MDLQFETIVEIFRKILQLNAVIILKSTNEYYRNIFSKSVRKMDLYPAMSHGSKDQGRSSCEHSRIKDHVVAACLEVCLHSIFKCFLKH